MSYKTRARKRQIRKHQKRERAAVKRIDRYLKSVREPRAVGLMPTADDPDGGDPPSADGPGQPSAAPQRGSASRASFQVIEGPTAACRDSAVVAECASWVGAQADPTASPESLCDAMTFVPRALLP
jgi:hypothetical protein